MEHHTYILNLSSAPIALQDFSSVAERTGTYTAFDYADIIQYLNQRWNTENRRDLTGEVRL